MTRKDYELIAATIRASRVTGEAFQAIALAFADKLAEGNPRFNRAQFLAACV